MLREKCCPSRKSRKKEELGSFVINKDLYLLST
jgi:hypothetical protein